MKGGTAVIVVTAVLWPCCCHHGCVVAASSLLWLRYGCRRRCHHCSLLKNKTYKKPPMKEGFVKLGIRTEMSGPKSCEVLASTCRLRRSLDGCLKFWRSGWSRRVWSRAEKKLKKGESKLKRSRLLS